MICQSSPHGARWSDQHGRKSTKRVTISPCSRIVIDEKKRKNIAILTEVDVIPLSYSKNISQTLPPPHFMTFPHHYQVIFLHTVAVPHELETALLRNGEDVSYNAVYIARFVGSSKSRKNLVFSSSGYLSIRHQVTSVLDIRVPQYSTLGYLSIWHQGTSVTDNRIPQYSASGYLSIRHQGTSVFDFRVPQYWTSGYLSIWHQGTSVTDNRIPQY
jgi:hypothetical protein